ncbi:RusA family crossover junction endodeoxyribonuclease [Mammaliicoccus sciuri]|uniref:RusA family crossover junction endodeoxyribonuclease n=1 Tax=Mammaliicoccus sciuri TaxID=1296 RepID=UPI0021CE99A0|nr:RusA family crossover junction endodeoxyribonuclease [Mammaliicoccus sciuri]UXV33123.1 RusA family crossover junction endodeoxyribonuclease [Mammaliicoccus sciuri]
MTVHSFTILFKKDTKHLDKPMASPRPRFRNVGKFIQTYMPTNYVKHKQFIKEQMPELNIDDAIKLTLLFEFPMNKSWSKSLIKRMIHAFKKNKPDIDNLIKTFMDAANQKIWTDDALVVEIHCAKRYAEVPKIKVKVEEL